MLKGRPGRRGHSRFFGATGEHLVHDLDSVKIAIRFGAIWAPGGKIVIESGLGGGEASTITMPLSPADPGRHLDTRRLSASTEF